MYQYNKLTCSKCGRKILVERTENGVSHLLMISVVCGDCVEISDGFKKEYSDAAKDIESWVKDL